MHAALERAQEFHRDEMAAALVRVRRIGEAIAKNPIAARERRLDHLDDVLAPRREDQQCLGFMRHRLGEQQLPQRLAERRAAGLPGLHDAMSALPQSVGEPRGVRALARAVDALERDETPAGSVIGHEERGVDVTKRRNRTVSATALLIF